MGVFDWIMKGIGFNEDEEENEVYTNTDDQISEIPERKKSRRELRREKKLKKKRAKNFELEEEPVSQSDYSFDKDQFNTNNNSSSSSYSDSYSSSSDDYSSSYNMGGSVGGYGTKNFVFFNPKNYDDVKKLVNYLRQSEPAIVNLEGLSDNEAQRILDFISGSVCALNGCIQRITGNIFLVAPEGFRIMTKQD